VSSVADNRGHLHDVCDLEELLRGCTQLEVRFYHQSHFLNATKITNMFK